MLRSGLQSFDRLDGGTGSGWPDDLDNHPAPAEPITGIRPLRRSDLPQLCDLFGQTFRAGRKVRRDDVAAAFETLYLTSPLDKIRPGSLVDIGSDGRVDGFMGTVSLAARFGDRALRGGMLGNFMARETGRAKTALRLIRATVAQDFDFVFSDTANQTSLGLSRAVKFNVLSSQSLEWIKVLRPAGTAGYLLGRRRPVVGRALASMTRVLDLAGGRLPFASLPEPGPDGIVDQMIDPADFIAQAPAFVQRYRIRPDWDDAELGWLIGQARRKTRSGPLHLREVLDRTGRRLGLYLMYARAGGVADVLQVLARRGREGVILAAAIRHAAGLGAVAVRGGASPAIIEGLTPQAGILYHHVAAAILFSRDPEIRLAAASGEAFLGGLMGESWTRLVADEFG